MSATANNSTPPAAPTAADTDLDPTEADVLAALGESTETPEVPESPELPEQPEEPEAPEAPESPESPKEPEEPEAPEAAPELTADQKELAALKQQLADLTTKLNAAPAAPAPAAPAAPVAPQVPAERPPLSSTSAEVFATVTDPGELAAREISLSKLHAWALRNEDGGKLGDLDISRADVLELKAATFEAIHQLIPERRQHLAEVARADGEALTAYPALKDANAPEAQAVAKTFRDIPALRAVPQAKLLAADAAVGAQLRAAGIKIDATTIAKLKAGQPAAPGTPAAPRQQPPRAPTSAARPGVLPPRSTPNASALKSATARLSSGNGSVDDVASVIAASLPQ
jgi:hypothetical protein